MAHYFSKDQDSPLSIEEINQSIFGKDFHFLTSGGVFSKGKVDLGTYVFLKGMKIKEGSRVLDLGCGYGVVGIIVSRVYSADVVMTDINKRAVSLAKKNAKRNGVSVEVLQGDKFSEVKGEFDTILLNPPQHAGKEVCLAMIRSAKDHLKKGGSIQIVARHKKGGKNLSEHMKESYGNCDVLYIKSGFRVYRSIMNN